MVSLTKAEFPDGETYGTTVYHGSHRSDLVRLWTHTPAYEGSLGDGIYVDFDPEVAAFYGKYVYALKLLVRSDEIFYLDHTSIEGLEGHSIMVGEQIPPFYFSMKGNLYTVGLSGFEEELAQFEEKGAEDIELDDLSAEVESVGYKALYVEGIRHYASVNSELLVFDEDNLQMEGIAGDKRDYRSAAIAPAEVFVQQAEATVSAFPGQLDFVVDLYKDDLVEIKNIRAKETQQGAGSVLMQQLSKLADQLGVTIRLHAEPFGEQPLRISKLKKFYRKFGFKDRKLNWMVRLPVKRNASMKKAKYLRYAGSLYRRVAEDSREKVAWNNKPTKADPDAVRELHIWIQTSSAPMTKLLKNTYYPPLLKRIQKDTYDSKLAVKHFFNFTEKAAQAYNKEHGSPGTPWHQIFNAGTRLEVAKLLLDDFEASDELNQLAK